MELKGDGLYVSRGLSFRRAAAGPGRVDAEQTTRRALAVPAPPLAWLLSCCFTRAASLPPPVHRCPREAEFSELECRLSEAQVAAYDEAALVWRDLRNALVTAQAGVCRGGGRGGGGGSFGSMCCWMTRRPLPSLVYNIRHSQIC
jgi:hypothetical protein